MDPVTLTVLVGGTLAFVGYMRKKTNELEARLKQEKREEQRSLTSEKRSGVMDLNWCSTHGEYNCLRCSSRMPLVLPQRCLVHSQVRPCSECNFLGSSYPIYSPTHTVDPMAVLTQKEPNRTLDLFHKRMQAELKAQEMRTHVEILNSSGVVESVRGRKVRSIDVEFGRRGFLNPRNFIHVRIEE